MKRRRGWVRIYREFFGAPESELEVQSVSEYLALRHGSQFLYRGQADTSWPLEPGLIRFARTVGSLREGEVQDLEIALLARFAASAPLFLSGSQPTTLWEWLVVGQHYGLPTRLLDWTTSALVALYFAVEGDTTDSGSAVWQFLPTCDMSSPPGSSTAQLVPIDGSSATLLREVDTGEHTFILQPRHINQRVRMQNSVFTLHAVTLPFKFREVLLRKFVIPKARRDAIRRELHAQGIHAGALFPDLQGLTKEAKEWVQCVHPMLVK